MAAYIVTLAFFLLILACYIVSVSIVHGFLFYFTLVVVRSRLLIGSLHVSLYFCPWVRMFRPYTFNIIVDTIWFTYNIFLFFCCLFCLFFVLSLVCEYAYFLINFELSIFIIHFICFVGFLAKNHYIIYVAALWVIRYIFSSTAIFNLILISWHT